MKIFGMVTTSQSWEYSSYALKSFFRNTKLAEGDRFFLIDNDSSFGDEAAMVNQRIETICNPEPKSFAANFNQIIDIASPASADVYFLNNDLIFTDGWIDPLLSEEGLVSPLSNREVQYEVGGFVWRNSLKLTDYLGKESTLRELVRLHRERVNGYKQVLTLPFFCIKLPYSVYSVVGKLDERFGKGGAEDDDYCLRSYLAGFDVRYALSSYVLHFSGKSTWSGAETPTETEERCAKFRGEFEEKWGSNLKRLLLDHEMKLLESSPELTELTRAGDFRGIVEYLARNRN